MSENDAAALGEERIEKGMRLAFGLASAKEGESILDVIERMSATSARLHLPDADDSESPVVSVPGPEDPEAIRGDPRYQIMGEIARGGVGVVFKGHDRDLGRDVAIKVLRKDLRGSPEIVQRFIEEAQVEGQLQHPGVVPVYGLGVQPDGRPYFAMKLIKGETMASLLKQRADVGQDRRKLLSIFEKVCDTVAYAHARRVLHRDLKPSNILVGAFGQVQVVDWGFAKVLSRGGTADEEREPRAMPETSVIQTVRSESTGSQSIAGSVMGTPAYMPPEQALGFVNRVDETSDVFSLGAILLEILTGQPPYTGKTSNELLVKAGQCEMDDGLSKLTTLGVDETLANLTRKCLAPAQVARPRNAGEVAAAITAYLASLEERARRAEVDAAEARVKAAGERRARRLTVALAAAVLLAVVAGSAGLWYAERKERDRLARAGDTVAEALEEAGVLLGSARKADVLDLAPWAPALAAAEQAAALSKKVGAPAEGRARAEAFLAQVRADEAAARSRAEKERGDREIVRRLKHVQALRYLRHENPDPNAEFGPVLEQIGINVDRPEEAAAAVNGSSLRRILVRTLEDWRWALHALKRDTVALETVLALVDPDETRTRIRAAQRGEDKEAVKKAVRALLPLNDSPDCPPETLGLLGSAVSCCAGDPALGLGLIRRWQQAAPDDPDSNVTLGHWLMFQTPLTVVRVQEAVAVLSRACTLDRENIAARGLLAACQATMNLRDSGIATLREAAVLAPELEVLRYQLSNALAQRAQDHGKNGNWMAAVEDSRAALAVKEEWHFHVGLAVALGQISDYAGVKSAMERALEMKPDLEPHVQEFLVEALLRFGKMEDALMRVETIATAGHGCQRLIHEKGLALAGLGRLEEAVAAFQEAKKAPLIGEDQGGLDCRIGRVLLADGRFEEAAASFREAIRRAPQAPDYPIYLARALRNAGDLEGARRQEEETARLQEEALKKADRKEDKAVFEFRRWGMFLAYAAEPGPAREALARAFPDASPRERGAFLSGLAATYLNSLVRVADAESCLREALEADPRSAGAWELIGWIRSYRGDIDGAAEAMRTSGECAGGEHQAHGQLIMVIYTAGRLDEALAVADACPKCPKYEYFRKIRELGRNFPAWERGEWHPEGEEASEFSDFLLAAGHLPAIAAFTRTLLETGPPATLDEEGKLTWRIAVLQHGAYGAAAQAGNPSLSPEERCEWRRLAAAWLTEMVELMPLENRYLNLCAPETAATACVSYLLSPILAPIRDEAAMADAPEADREACRRAFAALRAYHETVR